METMEKTSVQKEIFFDELYRLDDSDEEQDTSEAPLILRQRKDTIHQRKDPSTPLPKHWLIHTSCVTQPFRRTTSAPSLVPRPVPETVEVIKDTPLPSAMSLKRTRVREEANVITPSLTGDFSKTDSSKTGLTARRKRKRGQSLEIMPESQQLFKGFLFYFFPNNDIAPARRARIRKAMEWGALWVKEWKDGITHVVVDDNLCYNDLLSFLKVSALPSDISLVNEVYPSDCIKYRFAVNPKQVLYHVKGHPQVAEPSEPSVPAPSSESSLSLKLGKRELIQQAQTPSVTEESEHSPMAWRHVSDETHVDLQNTEKTYTKPDENNYDALDEAIEEARAVKDLPLDLDEDESPSTSAVSDDSDGNSSEKEAKKPKLRKGSFGNAWQQKFSCMQKHDGLDKAENPNGRTIEVLQQMADYYERIKDHWRLTAYRRAIAALRKETRKILTKEEAFIIPFIGERLAAKIEEIVWTNRLRRLENANLEPNDLILQKFMKIYGVGYIQASLWVDQGHRTLSDLASKAPLTKNQKIGIDHYDDFLQRIPRTEVTEHDTLVRTFIRALDPTIEVTIGGSYRRGAASSGDIDFILTKPDCTPTTLRTLVLDTIIPHLFASRYLRASLAVTSASNGSKWHGAACLPHTTIWRRIDFLLVPWEEMGAALIYFTGNDIFNRSIRLLASKKGMRLNQRGLWRDVLRGKNRERITQGSLVEGRSEERIFEVLGVPWRRPEHRIC